MTGGELLRYLVRHPEVHIAHLTSESYSGQSIHEIHKFLKGRLNTMCEKLNIAQVAKNSDVVFLGLPHGAAAKTAATALLLGVLMCFVLVGWQTLSAVIAVTLVSVGLGLVARAKIGGQTGDILGAVQQLAEGAALCALAASLT